MKYQKTIPQQAREIIFRNKRYRNTDIIKGLGISKASFYNWTNPKHRDYKPEFVFNIKQARQELQKFLEKEMIRQIEGYYIYEEKTITTKRHIKKIEYKKWVKGNTRLLIHALKYYKNY